MISPLRPSINAVLPCLLVPPALLLAALACPQIASAEPSGALSQEQIEKVEAVVTKVMAGQRIPGLSVAIGVDNELWYSNGFGFSDLENFVPAKATTVYRTASIAKPMTAVAAFALVERKRLDLDRDVRKYLPDFPRKRWVVTPRALLGHLGGVRHYVNRREAVGKRHYRSVPDALPIFAEDFLVQEPGTRFRYTTFGYNLVGAVLVKVARKPFVPLLRERVFAPAGMLATREDHHFALIPNRSRGYVRLTAAMRGRLSVNTSLETGALVNAEMHDTSMKIPGGGLVSTAPDLVRFVTAVNRGKLLKPTTVKQMWTEQKTRSGSGTGYGLGWQVGVWQKRPYVAHSGGQSGVSTRVLLLPEKGVAVSVMCNLQGARLTDCCQQLAEIALRGE